MLDDARYALRSLAKTPVFTAVVVLTLALGLGANTAVFSVIHAAMLTPLGYQEPDRLVRVTLERRDLHRFFPGAGFLDLRERSRTLDVASTYTYAAIGADLTDGASPERVAVTSVSANYFNVLGATFLAGRPFALEEERPGPRTGIISERLWRTYFGGSRDAVGQSLSVDGLRMQVAGVVASGFQDPLRPDVEIWRPENLQPGGTNSWENNRLSVIARLRPGVTLAAARAEAEALVESQAANYGTSSPTTVRVEPLQAALTGPARPMLLALLGAVALLLLLACVNIASLLMARGSGRAQEMAVRTALGSSRWRIVRQLLVESLLLSVAGGAAGLLLSAWTSKLLVSAAPVPLLAPNASLNAQVYLYCSLIALVAGLAFGVIPALQASRPDVETMLRDGGRAGSGRRQTWTWNALVAGQVALALVLLVGAGLLMRGVHRLQGIELGFTESGVLTMQVNLPAGSYRDPAARDQFHRALHERVLTLPGVKAVGATSRLPASGSYHPWSISVPGSESSAWGENRVIAGDYFAALGIPLLRGRTFSAEDTAEAERRVVLSRRAATSLFGESDPIGRQIQVLGMRATVIGVVGDAMLTARGVVAPYVYHSHSQWADDRNWALTQVVSASGDASSLLEPIRRELAAIDRALVMHQPAPLSDLVGRGRARERFSLLLFASFAGVAILLASIGLYGLLAYAVSSRRREIGIRMALGAPIQSVRTLFVSMGVRLTLAGIVAGCAGSLLLAESLRSLVFEVSVYDPFVLAGSAVVLLAVAMAAAWIPARAATRVDPLDALSR